MSKFFLLKCIAVFLIGINYASLSLAWQISMPGRAKIISIKVMVGQKIDKGDVLAITESMKINLKILSPVSGLVVRIDAKAGDIKGPDEALFQIATQEELAQYPFWSNFIQDILSPEITENILSLWLKVPKPSVR